MVMNFDVNVNVFHCALLVLLLLPKLLVLSLVEEDQCPGFRWLLEHFRLSAVVQRDTIFLWV